MPPPIAAAAAVVVVDKASPAGPLEELLSVYRAACVLAAGDRLETDIAPGHSGRADGFVANRLGDPSNPTLIYLPGLHSDDLIFWPNHASLADRFSLCSVRYRTLGEPSPEQYASDVLEMMDLAGIERAHLLGESMGSLPAQWLARHHPDRVESLILAGGFACPPDAFRMMSARAAALATPGFALRWAVRFLFYPCMRLSGLDGERFSPELMRGHAALRGPDQLRALRKRLRMISRWDFDAELPKIQCPFLYIHGSRDLTVPAGREANRYRQRIGGATIRELRGAPHAVLVLRPGECQKIIAEFAGKPASSAKTPQPAAPSFQP